jgi:hypothetical protein
MLTGAFISLLFAVLVGCWLAVLHFDGRGPDKTPWPIAALHAALALGGLAVLLVALGMPRPPAAGGTGGFGAGAAALFALAASLGGAIFLRFRRRHRPVNGLIGVHATLAVFGVVVLAAYVLAG